MYLNIKDIFPSIDWQSDYLLDINNFKTKLRSKRGYLLKLNSSCIKNLFEDFKETMQDSTSKSLRDMFESYKSDEVFKDKIVLVFESDFNFFEDNYETRIYKIVNADILIKDYKLLGTINSNK